ANDWRFRSLPAFVASLKRLQSMAWERCFPGHGEPFSDVAGAIATTLGGIESRTARVLSLLRERGPLTLWAICRALYPRTAVRRTWTMLATVQSHLDMLEEQGSAHAFEGAWHPHTWASREWSSPVAGRIMEAGRGGGTGIRSALKIRGR